VITTPTLSAVINLKILKICLLQVMFQIVSWTYQRSQTCWWQWRCRNDI